MCASAEGDGIAENLLCACKPGRAQVCTLDAKLWRLVKECGAHQLCLCAEGAGRARLHYILVLALRHAKLPGNPFYGAARREPEVHYAYQADAWHAIVVQVFPWIICLECALHALHGICIKTGRSVLCPYVGCWRRCCAGRCCAGMAVLGASDCLAQVQCPAQTSYCGAVLWVGDLQVVPEVLALLCDEGRKVL